MDNRIISIHAPRVGCDLFSVSLSTSPFYFNPRTPRGVRRHLSAVSRIDRFDFNPRTPRGVRRLEKNKFALKIAFQSTHPAWGATCFFATAIRRRAISIHAPRVGCDARSTAARTSQYEFQSTHPAWGATQAVLQNAKLRAISIHAPRVGCDKKRSSNGSAPTDFNPRTPRGVRHRQNVI